jgi:hypothetical protein
VAPSEDDLSWDEPLPRVIRLSPDYSAPLPLWGEGFGNIDWRFTKFPPELLDRLAAWQQDFDDTYHYQTGWRSAAIRNRWAHQAQNLAADLRAALGIQAEFVVDLWPIDENLGRCQGSNEAVKDQVRLGTTPFPSRRAWHGNGRSTARPSSQPAPAYHNGAAERTQPYDTERLTRAIQGYPEQADLRAPRRRRRESRGHA